MSADQGNGNLRGTGDALDPIVVGDNDNDKGVGNFLDPIVVDDGDDELVVTAVRTANRATANSLYRRVDGPDPHLVVDENTDVLTAEEQDLRTHRVMVGGLVSTVLPGIAVQDPQQLPFEQPPELLQAAYAQFIQTGSRAGELIFMAAPYRVDRSAIHPGDQLPNQQGWREIGFDKISLINPFRRNATEQAVRRQALQMMGRDLAGLTH